MNSDFELDSLIKGMAAEHRPDLPGPGLIWWRAQVLKKQTEKERVERPVNIMRRVALGFCVVLLAGLWISQRDAIRAIFGDAVLPVVPLLLAAIVIGAVFIGLMWWTTSEA
jgi:hypothetical protein